MKVICLAPLKALSTARDPPGRSGLPRDERGLIKQSNLRESNDEIASPARSPSPYPSRCYLSVTKKIITLPAAF